MGKRAEPLPPTYRVSFVTSLHLALARPCAQVKMGLHFGSFPEGHERAAKMGLHPATASHTSGSLAGGPTAAPHQSASPLGLPPLLLPLSFLPALVPALAEGEFWGNSTDLEFRESQDPINHWVLLQTARRLQHRGTPDWPMGCHGTQAAQVPFHIIGHCPGTHKTLPKDPGSEKNKNMRREGKGRQRVSAWLRREGSAVHKQHPLPSLHTSDIEASCKKNPFSSPRIEKKKKKRHLQP